MFDYLIVGQGLAGTCFAEVLRQDKKTFRIISDSSQQASWVAGGLYNPVILKRFTLAWMAGEQLDLALPFYSEIENFLGETFDQKLRVFRRFASVEEQNLWFEAVDKPGLARFLSTQIHPNENKYIDAAFGYGEVLETGRIDTKRLLEAYQKYLLTHSWLIEEHFQYNALKLFSDHVNYQGIEARNIIFAEGYGLKKNPYFNYLPLNGTKGELLTIRVRGLYEEKVIKSSVFMIPLGDDLYRIGATYKWKDKTNTPTNVAKAELLQKLQSFLKCDFEVVDHVAGVRPTVTDRRPLVGRHPQYQNMYVLNGFGSRGVLIGPYAAHQLYEHIENTTPLDTAMNIKRFDTKYQEA